MSIRQKSRCVFEIPAQSIIMSSSALKEGLNKSATKTISVPSPIPGLEREAARREEFDLVKNLCGNGFPLKRQMGKSRIYNDIQANKKRKIKRKSLAPKLVIKRGGCASKFTMPL